MAKSSRLESVDTSSSPVDSLHGYRQVVILSQGEAVPRNHLEVANPQLVVQRVATEGYDRTTLSADEEFGQNAIPEIDIRIKEALGLMTSNVIELPRDK